MNRRLWGLASQTVAIAVLCVCAFDMPRSFAVGQETDLVDLERVVASDAESKAVNNKETRVRVAQPLNSKSNSDNLNVVDSNDDQVAPSPKKRNSASLPQVQKKRTTSKRARKINVPATLGATKSTRKSEQELDKIFASRTTLAPNFVQYGPSARNDSNSDSYSLGSFESSAQANNAEPISKSFVTNAPYVERRGGVRQTNALSPEAIEPAVPDRYPLFEEDALTQESAPLNETLGTSAQESAPTALERIESKQGVPSAKIDVVPSPEPQNPFIQDLTDATKPENTFTKAETPRIDPFVSPCATGTRACGNFATSEFCLGNRFTRYTGVFADVELLGWQTDSIKQSYAISVDDEARVYDELSLTPSGTGYRGRLGLRTISGWDLTCVYTNFEADKRGLVSGNLYLSSGQNVDVIKGEADVELNIYDLEIGRWITREQWAVRPFAGVRWARLNQTQSVDSWNVASDGGKSEAGSSYATTASDYESVFARSNAEAYGLRLGAEGSIALFRNISAYGKCAATIAVDDVEYQTVSKNVQDDASVIRRAKKSCAAPGLETALGLAWRRGGLEIKGGYELNVLSNASCVNGKSSDFAARGFYAGVAWNN